MAIASILDRLDRCLGLLAAGHGAIPQFLPEFRGAIAALKGLPYAWRLRERSLVNDLEIAAASLEEDCARTCPQSSRPCEISCENSGRPSTPGRIQPPDTHGKL